MTMAQADCLSGVNHTSVYVAAYLTNGYAHIWLQQYYPPDGKGMRLIKLSAITSWQRISLLCRSTFESLACCQLKSVLLHNSVWPCTLTERAHEVQVLCRFAVSHPLIGWVYLQDWHFHGCTIDLCAICLPLSLTRPIEYQRKSFSSFV